MAGRAGRELDGEAAALIAALTAYAHACRGADDASLAVAAEELAGAFLRATGTRKWQEGRVAAKAGRKPVYDARWAKAALLDIVTMDPDGMPSRARLGDKLRRRFEAAGLTVPGDTWLKRVVAEFCTEAQAFEAEAVDRFRESPVLQQVFGTLDAFLQLRRGRRHVEELWQHSPELRSQFATPAELIEAALHKGF